MAAASIKRSGDLWRKSSPPHTAAEPCALVVEEATFPSPPWSTAAGISSSRGQWPVAVTRSSRSGSGRNVNKEKKKPDTAERLPSTGRGRSRWTGRSERMAAGFTCLSIEGSRSTSAKEEHTAGKMGGDKSERNI